MKTSVSTLPFYPQPLEDILNYLTDLNVDNCEIINEYPHDYFDLDSIFSYDISFSIHAPLSDVNLASHNKSIRDSSIYEVKKSMDLASHLGSDVVVVHPGQMPILGRKFTEKIFRYNRDSLKECAAYSEDVGVMMCVENMPDIESLLFKDLDELERLMLDLDAYVTLDVGHAHNNRFSTDDMIKFSRIKHIHLSDNDGSYDSHQALGKIDNGKGIDFKRIFNGLRKIKYDGLLVVEVEEPSAVRDSLLYLDNIN
jgi:sugar phosphate isomerase/epimerase